MLLIQVPMGGRGRRVAFHNPQGGEARGQQDQAATTKKERSFVRHSHHQQQQQQQYHHKNNNNNSTNSNNNNYAEHRFVQRERSFVRPQSTFAQIQVNKGSRCKETCPTFPLVPGIEPQTLSM
nr:myb-like protein P isoform X2 [Cherax quadricarinatus]